jgi:hypothetical protein
MVLLFVANSRKKGLRKKNPRKKSLRKRSQRKRGQRKRSQPKEKSAKQKPKEKGSRKRVSNYRPLLVSVRNSKENGIFRWQSAILSHTLSNRKLGLRSGSWSMIITNKYAVFTVIIAGDPWSLDRRYRRMWQYYIKQHSLVATRLITFFQYCDKARNIQSNCSISLRDTKSL